MANYSHPDLQRILAGLNGVVTTTAPLHTTENAATIIPGLGQAGINPPNEPVSAQTIKPAPINRESTPVADASTITTWPAALRHVTKHIASNEKAATRIKHLISQQHKHEREWWAGREAIIVTQQGRAGNQEKAASLLRAIGGIVTTFTPNNDPKADMKELEVYDKKVYSGLTKMAADIDRQLRALGVPFFAIKHDLVVLEHGEDSGGIDGRLDRGELREMQRKMLQTLEDLFMD